MQGEKSTVSFTNSSPVYVIQAEIMKWTLQLYLQPEQKVHMVTSFSAYRSRFSRSVAHEEW